MHSVVQREAVTIISYKLPSDLNFVRYTGQYSALFPYGVYKPLVKINLSCIPARVTPDIGIIQYHAEKPLKKGHVGDNIAKFSCFFFLFFFIVFFFFFFF